MSSHQVKFEPFDQSPANSLTDSFASTPGTNYPSLFDSPPMPPLDAFTPGSFDDEYDESIESTPAPEPEKKAPVKKRKSWGQQLPEPKTNLPPRKRAKTEDEKEQRRVERVLRNRRAAQSSRERKRLEVEGLEKEKRSIEDRNRELETRLHVMEMRNNQLQQQLAAVTGGDMNIFRHPSTTSNYNTNPEPLRCTTPVTFSKELFGSRDTHRNTSSTTQYSIQTSPHTIHTVNPASLSPEMRPVDQSNTSSSDMTQHPAAMLCDLQCQSEERPWKVSSGSINNTSGAACLQVILAIFLTLTSTISVAMRPLTLVCHSLKTGSILQPTTSILSTILWLATTPTTLSSTSANSSTTKKTQGKVPKFGLRIRLLRRLLACSPQLARPLLDATLGAMRLASKQQLVHYSLDGRLAEREIRGAGSSPSLTMLMTMAHSIKVIMKEQRQHQRLVTTVRSSQILGIRHHSDDMTEMLGRYELSFVSGMGDTGEHLIEKSLAGGKGRYGSREWE